MTSKYKARRWANPSIAAPIVGTEQELGQFPDVAEHERRSVSLRRIRRPGRVADQHDVVACDVRRPRVAVREEPDGPLLPDGSERALRHVAGRERHQGIEGAIDPVFPKPFLRHHQVEAVRSRALREPVDAGSRRPRDVVGIPILGANTGDGDATEAVMLGIFRALPARPSPHTGSFPVGADDQSGPQRLLLTAELDGDRRRFVVGIPDDLHRPAHRGALALGPGERRLLHPRMREAGLLQRFPGGREPWGHRRDRRLLVEPQAVQIGPAGALEEEPDGEPSCVGDAPGQRPFAAHHVAEPRRLLGDEHVHARAGQDTGERRTRDAATDDDHVERTPHGYPSRSCARPEYGRGSHRWHTCRMDDRELLSRAEEALTEIKISRGLSERHAAVLAALRIRLNGSDAMTLEEMLEAADEPGSGTLEDKLAEAERAPPEPKPSLDDLFAEEPKPKPDWPS